MDSFPEINDNFVRKGKCFMWNTPDCIRAGRDQLHIGECEEYDRGSMVTGSVSAVC